ncbi:MAG: DUF1508 domain-containing protein [Clostridiales bacterium]|nr:DUF1508 domain-containing protein [Clostridiales bacterium]
MVDFIKSVLCMFGKLFGFYRPVLFGCVILLAIIFVACMTVFTVAVIKESKKRKSNKEVVDACIEQEEVSVATEVAEENKEEVIAETNEESDKLAIKARYVRTYMARLIQSEDSVKDIYNALKNKLLSYKKVKARLSKKRETFYTGRNTLVKFDVKGKKVDLYLALNPSEFADKAQFYNYINIADKNAETPMLMKVSGPIKLRRALELIDILMGKMGVVLLKEYAEQDFRMPFETTEALIERGLIKDLGEDTDVADEAVEEVADVEEVQKKTKKLNGKWIIERESDDEFVSKLIASNGEVMLTSEIYTTADGAKSGIETIIRSIVNDNFTIYQDKNKNYYYKISSANNRLLCAGEIYKTKDGCLNAVESVKRIAEDSPVLDEIREGQGYAPYTPAQLDLTDVKKGTSGKWRIVQLENGSYSARLFASNGQLMLATEQVALEKSARNAIESVKKNAEQGNFIIDRDKFGRFYYKLRNAQKSVICMGEAYESLDSCVSAIESVRRFSLTAVLVEE